jgi:hypothetical protein
MRPQTRLCVSPRLRLSAVLVTIRTWARGLRYLHLTSQASRRTMKELVEAIAKALVDYPDRFVLEILD